MIRLLKTALTACIFFLFSAALVAQNAVWRDVYKVKKKDTIYGIAQSYGITVEDLIAANPEMGQTGYTLKKGETVFIPLPRGTAARPTTANATSTAAQVKTKISMGVMLPLHNNDGDGRRMVEYYRGLLIACDSLRKDGISVDVYAWNVHKDADIRAYLQNDTVRRLDLIVGPLYTKQVSPLAAFCRTNNIKLVIPFSTTAPDVQTNSHVFQVYQSTERLDAKAITVYVDRFKDYNTIIVECNDSVGQRASFVAALTRELSARGIPYHTTTLRATDDAFRAAFSGSKPNIVVLNTSRSPELNLVFRRLNDMRAVAPTMQISMFGYIEWLMYESTYRTLYHTYDVYIPSTFYYYKGLSRVAAFEKNYARWFAETMQEQYIPRFALTGYDHGQYFLRGIAAQGAVFTGTGQDIPYTPLQTPLRFQRVAAAGGYQNKAFELVHYRTTGIIDTIAY